SSECPFFASFANIFYYQHTTKLHLLFFFVAIKKQISISPKIVRVATGGRAELNCIANATPAAKVVWLKNGVPVQANPPFVLLADNSLLIARVEIQYDEIGA
uniref:Ig-like domain-containing protein n=1 Tax=Anopheles maculatus TaxID=74869 RepID=A0A182SRU2_9DIPT